jgi:hypothetical protein
MNLIILWACNADIRPVLRQFQRHRFACQATLANAVELIGALEVRIILQIEALIVRLEQHQHTLDNNGEKFPNAIMSPIVSSWLIL